MKIWDAFRLAEEKYSHDFLKNTMGMDDENMEFIKIFMSHNAAMFE